MAGGVEALVGVGLATEPPPEREPVVVPVPVDAWCGAERGGTELFGTELFGT